MVNNTRQVEVFGRNTWDGNYWSDYVGVDNNNDGIGDTPYQISWDVSDIHPYMQEDGWLTHDEQKHLCSNNRKNSNRYNTYSVM